MKVLKGHGTENDFVVVPDLDGDLDLTAARVRALCDRRAGIGADGVLRVVRSESSDETREFADQAPFFMDYRNADGSLAEMCGNGIRVFLRYLQRVGLVEQDAAVATRGGIMRVRPHEDGNVSVDMPLSNTYFVVAHFHMVMGVSPLLVIFGGIYHWYPLITGRRLNDRLGQWHFWITFLGTYAIFFPMHYLGVLGMPRRYYEFRNYSFIPDSAHTMNAYISIAAFVVALGQLLFLFNLAWSVRHGKPAGANPWRAASLEWQTPDMPPVHGNWGPVLPTVYRWPYEYSVPGDIDDFVPQNLAPDPRRPATLVQGDSAALHGGKTAPPPPKSPKGATP